MRLARVLGPVWGARRAAGLEGAKILRLDPLVFDGASLVRGGGEVEAVDRLGAGPGELVLVAHGSRVRDLTVGETVCDKDIVIAIVDGMDPAAREDGVDGTGPTARQARDPGCAIGGATT